MEELSKNDKRITDILNQKSINESQLIITLKNMLEDCPIINKFENVKELIFIHDFDILDNHDNNKFLFIDNLYNIISIINLLWEISKNFPAQFIHFINNLNIYFSFVNYSNEIGFILMIPLSENLYNYISTYGTKLFENNELYDKAVSFINFTDKYKYLVDFF